MNAQKNYEEATNNINDEYFYNVEVKSGKISIVHNCTSCMDETQSDREFNAKYDPQNLFYGSFLQRKLHAGRFQMPLCMRCRKIKQYHQKQAIVMSASSALLSYICFLVSGFFLSPAISRLLTLIVFLVTFAVGFIFRKTRDIGDAYTRIKSTNIKQSGDNSLIFSFANGEYAEAFYQNNKSLASQPEISDNKNRRYASNYIKAVRCPAAWFLISFAITVVLCICVTPIVNSFISGSSKTSFSPTANKNISAVNDLSAEDIVETSGKRSKIEYAPKEDADSDQASTDSETSGDSSENTAQQDTADYLNEPETKPIYNSSLPAGTEVYADIKSITPSMSLSFGEAGTWALCKCVAVSGEVIYVTIQDKDYISMIDNTANLNNPDSAKFKTVNFNTAKRFYGKVVESNSIDENLSATIGSNSIFDFSSMK